MSEEGALREPVGGLGGVEEDVAVSAGAGAVLEEGVKVFGAVPVVVGIGGKVQSSAGRRPWYMSSRIVEMPTMATG